MRLVVAPAATLWWLPGTGAGRAFPATFRHVQRWRMRGLQFTPFFSKWPDAEYCRDGRQTPPAMLFCLALRAARLSSIAHSHVRHTVIHVAAANLVRWHDFVTLKNAGENGVRGRTERERTGCRLEAGNTITQNARAVGVGICHEYEPVLWIEADTGQASLAFDIRQLLPRPRDDKISGKMRAETRGPAIAAQLWVWA
ncbi:hypothetical protein BH23GEM2_BH23GEM2_11900 [soil metagenome]